MLAKQLSFLPRPPVEYCAERGRRKIARPFSPKLALHVTMRATRARGEWSLLRRNHRFRTQALLIKTADRHHVRIYRYANVGNHLHLLLRAPSRAKLRAFLREFAGRVASSVTGGIKGRPEKFWDGLVWSKVVTGGRHFKSVSSYILLNLLEASGLRDRTLLARLENDGVLIISNAPD